MKIFVITLVFLSLFSCTTKIPRPLISSQNRLKDLSLWNEETKKEKIELILETVSLRQKRRQRLINVYPNGIYSKKALRMVKDPLVYYKDQRVKAHLERCDNQIASSSCFYVGKKLLNLKKYEDAYKILEKGCNLNEGEACYLAGVLEYNKKNESSANFYFSKGCQLDSDSSCFYKSLYYSDFKSMDESHKVNFFSHYCKMGNLESCAFNYLFKLEDSFNDDTYKKLVDLCDIKSIGEACYFLSYLHDKKDEDEKTLSFMKKACLNDDPQGCFSLVYHGVLLADHRKILLKRSLELGHNHWEKTELDPTLEWMRKDHNVMEMLEVYALKGAR